MASLLLVLGPVDAGAALTAALEAEGRSVEPGPAHPGDLLRIQLAAAPPPDAFTWAPFPGGAVVRLRPGGEGGLEPSLGKALADESRGLVLGLEVTRTREQYLTGSFLSGRTVELVRGGGEEATLARFTRWATTLLGEPPHRLGGDAVAGVLASPAAAEERPETPVVRLVVAGDTPTLLERPGELDAAQVGRLARERGRPVAGVGLASGGAAPWAVADERGEQHDGVADGHDALVAAMPRWALDGSYTGNPDARAPFR